MMNTEENHRVGLCMWGMGQMCGISAGVGTARATGRGGDGQEGGVNKERVEKVEREVIKERERERD